jgi:hypothetical protein
MAESGSSLKGLENIFQILKAFQGVKNLEGFFILVLVKELICKKHRKKHGIRMKVSGRRSKL